MFRQFPHGMSGEFFKFRSGPFGPPAAPAPAVCPVHRIAHSDSASTRSRSSPRVIHSPSPPPGPPHDAAIGRKRVMFRTGGSAARSATCRSGATRSRWRADLPCGAGSAGATVSAPPRTTALPSLPCRRGAQGNATPARRFWEPGCLTGFLLRLAASPSGRVGLGFLTGHYVLIQPGSELLWPPCQTGFRGTSRRSPVRTPG